MSFVESNFWEKISGSGGKMTTQNEPNPVICLETFLKIVESEWLDV